MLKIITSEGCVTIANDNFYIKEVASGLDELVFDIDIKDENYSFVVEEAIVEYEQPYLIKAIDAGAKTAKVKCQLNLDELKQTLEPEYTNGSDLLKNTVEGVLPNGWSCVDYSNSTIRRTIEGAYTPYDVLVQAMTIYDVVMRFNVKEKKVEIYNLKSFEPLGAFASKELNLKQIDYKGKSSDFFTKLYAYGKDGLSFADINDGKPFVENHEYSDKVICAVWKDERYENKESLLADAKAKVATAAKPESSYICSVYDLAAVDPEMYGFQDFSLFSVIRLIDDNKQIMVNHQVVEYCRYPFHPEKNIVTLSAKAPNISSLVKDMITKVSDLQNNVIASSTVLKKAIESATELITGNRGGNIVFSYDSEGLPYEILIMDTNDIKTAQKVWRWNLSGLGYSKNGYNGPYELAMTMDGAIVADMITTGILNANLLKTGKISCIDGLSYWDLDTNEFKNTSNGGSDTVTIKQGIIKIGGDGASVGVANAGISMSNGSNEVLRITNMFGKAFIQADNDKGIYFSKKQEDKFMTLNEDGCDAIMMYKKLYASSLQASDTEIVGSLNVTGEASFGSMDMEDFSCDTASVSDRADINTLVAPSLFATNAVISNGVANEFKVKSNAYDEYYKPVLASSNEVCLHWTGEKLGVYIDTTLIGYVNLTS